MTTNERVKIVFPLEKDIDDYPPDDYESLWAIPKGGEAYEIDNIPFFVSNIALGDIVRAIEVKGELIFDKIIQRSGNSTLRVYVFNSNEKGILRNNLRLLGCSTEGSHIDRLFSVNIPKSIDRPMVIEYLKREEQSGTLEYEEACIYS
jgi:hypothetical protein